MALTATSWRHALRQTWSHAQRNGHSSRYTARCASDFKDEGTELGIKAADVQREVYTCWFALLVFGERKTAEMNAKLAVSHFCSLVELDVMKFDILPTS